MRSDASALEVEWTLERTRLVPVGGEERTFRRPSFPGALHLAREGEPDVPTVVRLLGIPLEGLPRVHVVAVETVSESVPDLAPGPRHEVLSREGKLPLLREIRSWQGSSPAPGLQPSRWAELLGVFSTRGQRVARLALHPWRWDASTGELVWARRLVVRVEFGQEGLRRRGSEARRESAEWEQVLRGVLLNAEVARAWRAPRPPTPPGGGASDSFDSSPHWLKVPIRNTGLYLIDYFTFANLGFDPQSIDPTTIRVFCGTNLPLPEDYATPPQAFMTECALFELNSAPDPIFDLEDRFLFYALAPNGWAAEYDSTRSRTDWVENPFTDLSSYWITWGGTFSNPPKRMTTRDVNPNQGGPVFQTAAPQRLHFEENNLEEFRFPGEDGWMWESLFGRGQDRLYLLDLDRVDSGDGVVLARVYSYGAVDTLRTRDVQLKVAGNVVAEDVWVHSSLSAARDISGCFQGLLADGANAVRLNVRTSDPTSIDKVYTGWFDVEYSRKLVASGGRFIRFFSAPNPPPEVDGTCPLAALYGATDYRVEGFHSWDVYLFDVTDQHDVVSLVNYSRTASSPPLGIRFSDPGASGVRWYVAATMEGVLPLPTPEIVQLRGLRDSNQGAEYVVIYHPKFREGAERLAALRRDLSWRPRSVMAVDLMDVYNEFSWGMVDAVAIRDFLAYAYAHWQGDPLRYVTLVGDAAYDTKKFLSGSPENLLPTYEGRYRTESLSEYVSGDNLNFYSTDDFFGYLEAADYSGTQQPGLDVAIGRYPVSTEEDFDVTLGKLESYLSYEMPGQWQNRIILTADDERTPDAETERMHTDQVEKLARERVPPAMDRVKIYLTEYPRNEFGKKPEAQADFIEEFTRGALMTTYTGHGDQNTMAQEEVFVSQKIPELLNEKRYTVFSTFSCTVSRFDLLSGNSMTELLLLHEDGGCVTSFASGGLVFPNASADLNQEWLGEVFGTPYLVDTYSRLVLPLGLAAMVAKYTIATDAEMRRNNEKYVLLGDPALEVRFGRNPIEFEATTVDSNLTDGLLRVIRGTVLDINGHPLDGTGGTIPFNGTAYVHVTEDADTTGYDMKRPNGTTEHIHYVLEGPTAYRGEVPVRNGCFEAKFYLSEAVPAGNRGRVSVFALEEDVSRDASGAYDTLVLGPTVSAGQVDDSEGPVVRIRFDGYPSFVDGDLLFTDKPVLTAELSDSSGINLRLFPQFARLQARIDDQERVDLTEDFTYVEGSFTHGRVRRILPLGPGEHTLEVKAFDNVGNRGSARARFTIVLPEAEFDIVDRLVAVYPNPFTYSVDFTYQLTRDGEVDLKVFTLTGRKIYERNSVPAFAGANVLHWNGLDQNGGPLANGTYLFEIRAVSTDEEGKRQRDRYVGHVVKMK